ncbi:hypothetical protein P9112_008105 [Eukaryota sp. TZLM1-RC]
MSDSQDGHSFTRSSSPCGQALLRLVSRANAIVAECLRLAQNIPEVFTLSTKSDRARYGSIILDFSYLDQPEHYEFKIKQDPDVLDLDEEFPTNHMELLERFYKLFESIIKYHSDFSMFLHQLTTGIFIQHTLSGVLADIEGRQLLSEGLSMFAVILLLMDIHIPGVIRERLVVSYYRYKGSAELPHFDEITKLCKQTGFNPSNADKYGFLTLGGLSKGKRAKNYPQELFERFPFSEEVVSMVLGRLRADDVYYRMEAFPDPDHRSTALSLQAAHIFLLLFFQPDTLKNSDAVMREIVDKHFSDNWIISFYLGHLIDLTVAWEPYKAAKNALNNTINPNSVRKLTQKHISILSKSHKKVLEYLAEGVLNEPFVLNNADVLLTLIRNVNVSLRFLLSHTIPDASNPKYKQILTQMVNTDSVLSLLLLVSDLEYKLKTILDNAFSSKMERWTEYKDVASSKMTELADYFAGDAALSKKSKDQNLQTWFKNLSTEIGNLNLDDSVVAGRQIASLINALEEVEQFHQIESSLHVKQFLADTRGSLQRMLRVTNLSPKTLLHFTIASDFAYAWRFLPNFTDDMQQRVRKDPRVVLQLRALFLKAASILEVPLVRIQQANSSDLASVANYYSTQLVAFVRRVLQVVPTAMFDIFSTVISLISEKIVSLPGRIPRDDLPNYAQFDLRYQLSQKTHEISLLAEGILAMQKTLVGIIEIDPKLLLEDGVEAELVVKLSNLLNDALVFKKKDPCDFSDRFAQLYNDTHALCSAMEYIQDYLSIYGLKVWQKVISRIIYFHVEQECNLFLRDKVYAWDSKYQSEVAPIPKLEQKDPQCETFVGRIVNAIFDIIDSKKVSFSTDFMSFVRSAGTEIEVLNQTTFGNMYKVLGAYGLSGLDRMFGFICVRELRYFFKDVSRLNKNKAKVLKNYSASLTTAIDNLDLVSCIKVFGGLTKKLEDLISSVLSRAKIIGLAQLVRTCFQNQLKFSAEVDAFALTRTLSSVNEAILNQISAHNRTPERIDYPEYEILGELSTMIESAGLDDPLLKLYSLPPPALEAYDTALILFSTILFVCEGLLSQHGCVNFNKTRLHFGEYDCHSLFHGLVTIVRQFPMVVRSRLVALIAFYIKSMFDVDHVESARAMVCIVRQLIQMKLFSRAEFEVLIDPCVLDL